MTERINDLISSSYDVACKHGFHDVETSIEHQMMLVIGELGEAVEADRKNRRADVDAFKELEKIRIGSDEEYASYINKCFVEHIKDTVEDELADVCIRLFDICGYFQIDIAQPSETMVDDWVHLFGSYSFTEKAYAVVRLLSGCQTGCAESELSTNIGSALYFIQYWCDDLGIDLDWHIDAKERYNSSRERLHGKKY